MKPKPCPFCGSTDIRYQSPQGLLSFRCHDCFAQGPFANPETTKGTDARDTLRRRIDEGLRLWNHRAGDYAHD